MNNEEVLKELKKAMKKSKRQDRKLRIVINNVHLEIRPSSHLQTLFDWYNHVIQSKQD